MQKTLTDLKKKLSAKQHVLYLGITPHANRSVSRNAESSRTSHRSSQINILLQSGPGVVPAISPDAFLKPHRHKRQIRAKKIKIWK